MNLLDISREYMQLAMIGNMKRHIVGFIWFHNSYSICIFERISRLPYVLYVQSIQNWFLVVNSHCIGGFIPNLNENSCFGLKVSKFYINTFQILLLRA